MAPTVTDAAPLWCYLKPETPLAETINVASISISEHSSFGACLSLHVVLPAALLGLGVADHDVIFTDQGRRNGSLTGTMGGL
jgi:hypothetical protein